MSENVKDVVRGIKDSVTQNAASNRDEVRVMQAMLNDRSYEVGVYGKNGQESTYAPGREFRGMVSDIVASATKIEKGEAESLVEGMDFHRSQAAVLVDFSKEFVNTYMGTGRKMNLGGRVDSNVSLSPKVCEAGMRRYPTQIDTDAEGNAIFGSSEVWVESYTGIKASSPCPVWVSKK